MSLLDDVSIVVTPNGYKAGELYAVIPVPTEGSEKIINGSNTIAGANWNANSNWDKTVAGLFSCDGTSSADINQGGNLPTVNLQYIISFEILSINSGGKFVANYGGVVGTNRTSVGVYSEIITAVNSTERIRVRPNATGTVGSVTGISVKEYTSADMDVTRATDATRVDENGLIADVLANVPRIDYTGGGCPHILAEPQRTNLIPYSDFSDFSTIGDSVITLNNSISPDGTNNATNVTFTTGRIDESVLSFTDDTDYTFSFWAKKGGTLTTATCFVKINSGSNISQQITLTDNWQKFSLTANSLTGSSVNTIGFRDEATDIELFGAQLEEGSYPTSLIPTSGSTVTRNQDIFTRDGIGSLINSEEGVLFGEIAALSDDGTNRYLSINDGTTSNYIYFRFVSTSNTVLMRTVVAGVTINTLQTAITDTTDFNKFAFKWKSGDYAFWINGVESLVDASATIFGADVLNTIEFSFPASGGGGFPSKVKQLQVYDTALDDTQLAALTS